MGYVSKIGNPGDPAFLYESLARHAFNCDRFGGPNKVADQSRYSSLFMPKISNEGVIVINQILEALKAQTDDHSKLEEFEKLSNAISIDMDQESCIRLMEYIINVIEE